MRKIVINNLKDFNLLRGLTGNETIQLVIKARFPMTMFHAISLDDFSGTICIATEVKDALYHFKVLVNSAQKNKWIFSNTRNASIQFGSLGSFITAYEIVPKTVAVSSEKDFLNIHNLLEKYDVLNIILLNDIYLQKSSVLNLKDSKKTVNFNGGGHTIFNPFEKPKNIFIKPDSSKLSIKNTFFKTFQADNVIEISDVMDLEKLRCLPADKKVCVEVTNNIDALGKEFSPIDLSMFYGSLLVLGENHAFRSFSFTNKDATCASVGLFGDLSYSGSIMFYDMVIEKSLLTRINDFDCVGAFLGNQLPKPKNMVYSSGPGLVAFHKCGVNNISRNNVSTHFGLFTGSIEEDIDYVDCFSIKAGNPENLFFHSKLSYYLSEPNVLVRKK